MLIELHQWKLKAIKLAQERDDVFPYHKKALLKEYQKIRNLLDKTTSKVK